MTPDAPSRPRAPHPGTRPLRFRCVLRRLLAAVALGSILVACSGGGDEAGPTEPGPDPEPDPDPPAGDVRSYAMGFAPGAPRPDEGLLLQVIDSMARVSEITIIQQEVPWEGLLSGIPMDTLLEERAALADFLRAKGMAVIFLVDPLDGLDRTSEAVGLQEAGRSILEPEIRETHEAWVLAVAQRIEPRYMGLASEINTLAARGEPALFAELREMINGLAPRVRSVSPDTDVFVSFQADEATGALVDPIIDHFALIGEFDIDALGLSSYPVFAFETPGDVPDDYLAPFDAATDLPLLMVEGGWSSEDVGPLRGTPREQADYFRRYEELLDAIDARAWVGLTFTDLDVDALGVPPERVEGLSRFAHMGLLDVDLRRKPAYDEWARIFARPLR